eukprot:scaffold851_cov67-Phaeocystis_antarctica.AAC.1
MPTILFTPLNICRFWVCCEEAPADCSAESDAISSTKLSRLASGIGAPTVGVGGGGTVKPLGGAPRFSSSRGVGGVGCRCHAASSASPRRATA